MSNKTPKPVAIEPEAIEPEVCDGIDCDDCECETVAVVTEEPAPVVIEAPAGTYTVKDGDTYAGIAKAHKPEGMTSHEYAVNLFAKNQGKTLSAGTVIKL